MDILSICCVCLVTAIFARLIKQVSPEICFAISAAAVILVFGALSENISQVFDIMNNLAQRTGISNGYVMVAIKVLGISYISELCSTSCRDAGESTLGSIIDLSAKVMITIICLPIVNTLMEVIMKILENE